MTPDGTCFTANGKALENLENLENRKNTKTLSIQVGQPFRRERFKSTFEDKRLKEGGCHETIYKS
eukprot:SAG11_NODE_31944_length_287_cov_2.515957_1_plen_64_part_01